jgi:hypothetical protein
MTELLPCRVQDAGAVCETQPEPGQERFESGIRTLDSGPLQAPPRATRRQPIGHQQATVLEGCAKGSVLLGHAHISS